jgi:hypothetical protein
MAKLVLKAVGLGAVGGAVFVFLFPKGAITTLMHDVLHLPGPGAGIAAVLGPFMLILALLAYRRTGGPMVVALSFSVVVALLAALVSAMNPKGGFSTIWPVLACAVCALGVEGILALTGKWSPPWRLVLAGVAGNLVLLAFYWVVIFPRTARWVLWGDVPVLLCVCVAGGLLAGLIAWLVSKAILSYAGRHRED